MRRAMQKRIDKISARPCEQDESTPKSRTQHAGYVAEENRDGGSIARCMGNVRVKSDLRLCE